MEDLSLHSVWNIPWLDAHFKAWQSAPEKITPEWSHFFTTLTDPAPETPKHNSKPCRSSSSGPIELKLFKVLNAYRRLGHLQAQYNPLSQATPCDELRPEALGLEPEDLHLPAFEHSNGHAFLEWLAKTYCGSLAYVYTHIEDAKRLEWLQEAAESQAYSTIVTRSKSHKVLEDILKAEGFESFLDQKFRGKKRFSLEGLSVLIPSILELLELSAEASIQKVFIAASHRGRLNLLAHVLHKPLANTFKELLDQATDPLEKGGDVKYHLGWDGWFQDAKGRSVDVHLSPNPSHLEAIYPVVEGKTKAWQNLWGEGSALSIVLHGDAAFAGQGTVAETLNYSELPPYDTHGTIHLILNNQIGFTTLACQGRSSRYSGAIAKSLDAPLLLVNSEDLFAVLRALKIAFEYRQRFHKSIFIELYGYRKEGHNEIDEPSFTQYKLYQELQKRPRLSELFLRDLAQQGVDLYSAAIPLKSAYTEELEAALQQVKSEGLEPQESKTISLSDTNAKCISPEPPKPIAAQTLNQLAETLWTIPEDLHIHPKLARQLEAKKQVFPKAIDWSFAEALALGSLLQEGYGIRLSGEDSERGTFSQRHAVWHDIHSTSTYTPLKALAKDKSRCMLHNTPLSEASILGFEYGYSIVDTACLTLWEAQFGDFANGAQVMIDQFITSGEAKWGQKSRLVLLLPHGHQGQGPDHSSARIERFLQACADHNIQVCSPTTPAQYFHLLRRQMHQRAAKPLIILTPKNLFRHKDCISSLDDLSGYTFKTILQSPTDYPGAKTVLLCTGKIYYELLAHPGCNRPIFRLEQLYPLDLKSLQEALAPYGPDCSLVWVQEEPQNMGAWSYIAPILSSMHRSIQYVGRPASASPDCGSFHVHALQQEALIQKACFI